MVSDPVAATDWRQLAADIRIPEGIFIGGERRAAIDGSTRAVNSARDGSPWWTSPGHSRLTRTPRWRRPGRLLIGAWPRMHPRARGEILQEFAHLVEAHREEIALLISLEMGKPIRHAYEIELRALIRCLRFYGELADKESGDITPSEEGELALVTREPAGVVAAVVPWNFPLTLGGWKLAPALAAGCTVVLKTAEQSPLSMQRVAELGVKAGLPPGVFNVLSGDGPMVGRHLGEHPDVDVLTFTGSTDVGRHFLRYAADSNLKRVYLELGGKSPNIIFPDAPDLDLAADTAAWAIFFNSGEMCTAGSRLVVHADVADRSWSGSWRPLPSGSRPIHCCRTPGWVRWSTSGVWSGCSAICSVGSLRGPHYGSAGSRSWPRRAAPISSRRWSPVRRRTTRWSARRSSARCLPCRR